MSRECARFERTKGESEGGGGIKTQRREGRWFRRTKVEKERRADVED